MDASGLRIHGFRTAISTVISDKGLKAQQLIERDRCMIMTKQCSFRKSLMPRNNKNDPETASLMK